MYLYTSVSVRGKKGSKNTNIQDFCLWKGSEEGELGKNLRRQEKFSENSGQANGLQKWPLAPDQSGPLEKSCARKECPRSNNTTLLKSLTGNRIWAVWLQSEGHGDSRGAETGRS